MGGVMAVIAHKIEVHEGAWHHSEFPHPLVTLDFDTDGKLLAVVVLAPSKQPPGAVDLLRWALPYLPEPLPSMEGGAYAENYDRAMTLSANTTTGGSSPS